MKSLSTYISENNDAVLSVSVIRKAISRLPEPNRVVIEWHFHEGLTRKEIAARLNCTVSTVHNRFTRGITLLKIELNPGYFQRMDRIMSSREITKSSQL